VHGAWIQEKQSKAEQRGNGDKQALQKRGRARSTNNGSKLKDDNGQLLVRGCSKIKILEDERGWQFEVVNVRQYEAPIGVPIIFK
jgi:hypothetical protein